MSAAHPAYPAVTAALILGAYLLGSVSWSTVIVRALSGLDIRTVGSGNAGASNVLRSAGGRPAALVLFLDVAKGVIAVLFARFVQAAPPVVGAVALAVVLGHVFPLFFGFRGGKGVATAAGSLGALAPLALVLALLVFCAVVAWRRYVSLGSMVTAALFPVLAWLGQRLVRGETADPWVVIASGAIAAVVLVKHRHNWQRLRRGLEPRLGERAAGSSGLGAK